MSLTTGDYISILTGGFWEDVTGGAPATPTLSVSNDGDGDAVTASVTGAVGATNTLYYMLDGAAAWTAGNSRSGDGDIAQTGLDENRTYSFIAVSVLGGVYSLPSPMVQVNVSAGSLLTTGIDFSGMLIANIIAFGETVTYKPSGGVARSITANVNRQPYGPIPESDQESRGVCHVTVRNVGTTGIAYAELNIGKDTISFARRRGGTATDNLITRLVEQIADGMIVECA